MGWWTDPVGSKPNKPIASRGKPAAKTNKCPICKKAAGCRCGEQKQKPVKEKVVVTDKNDKKRTVTRNSKVTVDAKGFNWCAECKCRVINGSCTNITCSTRK
jgi:hypothetical protein